MKSILLSCVMCLFIHLTHGQSHKVNWYFGKGAGLEFGTGNPVATSFGNLNTDEGSATISDQSGNLLFYTNGQVVYNSNHTIMPNGTGLGSTVWTCQPAVIVPLPGSPTIFYLFTVTNWIPSTDYLNYSIIDMSLNGGLGDVTATKAVVLDSNYREQLTVAPHSNGTDFWIISHKATTNEFASFLLTAGGITTIPVISATGMVYSGVNRFGSLRISHDCTKIVSVLGSASSCNEVVQLLEFNNTSGQVFNPITLATYPNLDGVYSAEFSPDNSKLYVAEYNGVEIMQFDLNSPNITNSMISIANGTGIKSGLQLGPDGKIYVGKANTSFLGVIEFPDVAGINCNYVNNAVALTTGNYCSIALPNFFDYSCNFQTGQEETDNFVANVFPNPAKDEINFILENPININQIEIFDLLGSNIFISHQNIERYSDSIKIDISTLPTGVYYCMIKSYNFDFKQTFSVLKD